MKKNILLNTIFLTALLASDPFEVVRKDASTRHNEIDQGYEAEQGWMFYQDKLPKPENEEEKQEMANLAKTMAKKDKSEAITQLLAEILSEQKKQTGIQEKMLHVLQKAYDPQPIVITRNDGTTCKANDDSDCYKWIPAPGTEVERNPIMKRFYESPTRENALAYKQWEAQHFMHNKKIGWSGAFTVMEKGSGAFPANYTQPGFNPVSGGGQRAANKYYVEKVAQLGSSINYSIYLGKNRDADIFAINNIVNIVKSFSPKSDMQFVFENEGVKTVFEEVAKSLPNLASVWAKASKTVNRLLFEEKNIYATPMIKVTFDDGNQTFEQTVSVGNESATVVARRINALMQEKGMWKPGDDTGDIIWNQTGDKASDFMKDKHRFLLNEEWVKEKYETEK